jgi:hypothetical protein
MWWEPIVEKIGTRLIGSFVTKGITALAAALATHGYLAADKKDNWIQVTVESVLAIALGAFSSWLSKWREGKKAEQIVLASTTGVVPTHLEEAKQNFTFGGVGAGNTDIKKGS